jgi:hypothetical protein
VIVKLFFTMMAVVVLSLSCVKDEPLMPPRGVDPAAAVYVDAFKKFAAEAGLPKGYKLWGVNFGRLGADNRLGECSLYIGRNDKIVGSVEIDPQMKGVEAPEDMLLLRAIVYHELGHCIYNMPHTDSAKDLMFPEVTYAETEEELHAQLLAMFDAVKKKRKIFLTRNEMVTELDLLVIRNNWEDGNEL